MLTAGTWPQGWIARGACYSLGLAIALFETQPPDVQGALEQLHPLAGNKDFADYPFVLYYSASAHRGLGIKELEQAKPADATQKRALAQKHFEEAARQFAAAALAFTASGSGHPGIRDVIGAVLVGAVAGVPLGLVAAWITQRLMPQRSQAKARRHA